jgi:hypothetical protein
VHELTPTTDQNLFNGLLRTWTVLLKVFDDEQFIKENDKKALAVIVDSSFIYSAIWSLCTSVDTDSRKKFDLHFKKICEGQYDGFKKFSNKKVLPNQFDRGTIYDYVYESREQRWRAWTELKDLSLRDQFEPGTLV